MFGKFLKSEKWHKYFGVISKILTPKFLYDCVVPKDITSTIKTFGIKHNEEAAFNYIIMCSIFNAIFVGLPGAIGWGVVVSMAVEFVMAVQIAYMTGLIEKVSIFNFKELRKKLFSLLAAVGFTTVTVLYLFKKSLDLVFNIFSSLVFTGFVTATSVFFTTVFYGLFIFLAFSELKKLEKEKLSYKSIFRITGNTSKYTTKIFWSLSKMIFKVPKMFMQIKKNVTDAFNVHTETDKIIRGDLFHVTALAYLLQNKEDAFNGPFSKLWLEAVRLSHPTQLGENATFQDIREHLSNYDSEQYPKVLQNIKSKFFEVAETHYENNDGDELSIELIKEQNNPGFDAISTNHETGQKVIFNYKFTDDLGYIENHLQNYPDLPVVVPADIYEKLKDNPLVVSGDIQSGNFEKDQITDINKDNFDNILKSNEDLMIVGGIAIGGTTLAIRLLPFLYAYFRSRISKEQLQKAVTTFFPEVTANTLNRLAMLTLIGPVYGFFMLANLGLKTSTSIFKDDVSNINPSKENENKENDNTNEKKERKMTRRDFITLSFTQK